MTEKHSFTAVPLSHRAVVPTGTNKFTPYTKLLCVALADALQGRFDNTFPVSYYGDNADQLEQISVEFMPKGTSYTTGDGKTSTTKQSFHKFVGALTFKNVMKAAESVHKVQTFLKKKNFSFNLNLKDN